jgi:hypothetical protein
MAEPMKPVAPVTNTFISLAIFDETNVGCKGTTDLAESAFDLAKTITPGLWMFVQTLHERAIRENY